MVLSQNLRRNCTVLSTSHPGVKISIPTFFSYFTPSAGFRRPSFLEAAVCFFCLKTPPFVDDLLQWFSPGSFSVLSRAHSGLSSAFNYLPSGPPTGTRVRERIVSLAFFFQFLRPKRDLP